MQSPPSPFLSTSFNLAVRAGSPPPATTMLIRYQHIEDVDFRLTELWRTWESWFVDIEETHTSYPILVDFRSLCSDHSWVSSAGVILDAASLWVSSVEHSNDPDAQLCIRAGYLSLRWIGANLGIPLTRTQRLMTQSRSLKRSSNQPAKRWPQPASTSDLIENRRGGTLLVGWSTMTRYCSIWPDSSKRPLSRGSLIAVQ